jgi:hypothetical protein
MRARAWLRSPFFNGSVTGWKELRTLLQTLQHEASLPASWVKGRRVYYFTDNSTVNHLVRRGRSTSRGLQRLVMDINARRLNYNSVWNSYTFLELQ